jgi:hypothetical protein
MKMKVKAELPMTIGAMAGVSKNLSAPLRNGSILKAPWLCNSFFFFFFLSLLGPHTSLASRHYLSHSARPVTGFLCLPL